MRNPLTYPILIDLTIIALIIAMGFILSETLLPGIISPYISPFILFGSIFTVLSFAILFAHKQHIFFTTKKRNVFLLICSTLIFGLLIAIASFRFGMILGIFFTLFCMMIFISFYATFREKIS